MANKLCPRVPDTATLTPKLAIVDRPVIARSQSQSMFTALVQLLDTILDTQSHAFTLHAVAAWREYTCEK
jgi:hypothetical protein